MFTGNPLSQEIFGSEHVFIFFASVVEGRGLESFTSWPLCQRNICSVAIGLEDGLGINQVRV